MSLVSDIVNDALYYIGAYPPGATVSNTDQTFGLRTVNRALDGWSARKISPLGIVRSIYTLGGQPSYTFGAAGTWTTAARPVKIKAASTLAANGTEKEARVVDASGWAAVADKSRTGIFIEDLYWDGGFPSGNVWVSPMPFSGACILYTYQPIADFVNLTDTVSLPAGYERALVIAFALELCIPFQRPIPDGLPQLAQQAMTDIAALSAEILGTAVPQAPAEQAKQ